MVSKLSRILCAAALLFAACGAKAEEAPIGVLLAVGDIAPCGEGTPPEEQSNAKATRDIIVAEVNKARSANLPVRVIALGDLAYEYGEQPEFECYRKLWHDPISAVLAAPDRDWLPVPGNHEYKTEEARDFFAFFARNAWLGKGTPGDGIGYYRSTFPEAAPGAWQLIGLNSNIDGSRRGAQYESLNGFLKASTSRCVLAFWHAPVFSSGHHGHDESGNFGKGLPKVQQEMFPIFQRLYNGRASVILNGHDHGYEEFLPFNPSHRLDSHGLRAFVVGTGGHPLHRAYKRTWNDFGDDISAGVDTQTFGVLRLDLFPDRYKWSFVAAGNGGPLVKHGGAGNCNER